MKTTSAALLAASLSFALAGGMAFAQEDMGGMDMGGMDMGSGMAAGDTVTMSNGMEMAAMAPMADEGMRPFMEPMDAMMAAMPMTSTGMPDADFLLMMIPHHQSAVEMARAALEKGTDEETRAMAQEIIDAQEAEIAQMRAMLERMGVQAPAAAE